MRNKILPYWVVLLCVLGNILNTKPAQADEALVKAWQGEWGHWDKLVVGQTTRYVGGHLSIYDCQSADNRCKLHFMSRDKSGSCHGDANLTLLSASKAQAVSIDFAGRMKECQWNLTLVENGTSMIRVERQGTECNHYCSQKPFFTEIYPLISHDNISRNWDPRCYENPSKTLLAWCASSKIQDLDSQMRKLWVRVSSAKGESPPYYIWDESWTTILLENCDHQPKIDQCLEDVYRSKIVELNAALQTAAAAYETPGDPVQAKKLLKTMAGVYKMRFQNGDVTGRKFQSENVFEFVPVSNDAAYVKAQLNFFNGHECNIAGIAEYKKVGGFVFQDVEGVPKEERCLWTIRLIGSSIYFNDSTGHCQKFCGSRGGLNGGKWFSLNQKRPIRYMPLILCSEEYQTALREYKARHLSPAQK